MLDERLRIIMINDFPILKNTNVKIPVGWWGAVYEMLFRIVSEKQDYGYDLNISVLKIKNAELYMMFESSNKNFERTVIDAYLTIRELLSHSCVICGHEGEITQIKSPFHEVLCPHHKAICEDFKSLSIPTEMDEAYKQVQEGHDHIGFEEIEVRYPKEFGLPNISEEHTWLLNFNTGCYLTRTKHPKKAGRNYLKTNEVVELGLPQRQYKLWYSEHGNYLEINARDAAVLSDGLFISLPSVFEDQDDYRAFLVSPSYYLGGERPILFHGELDEDKAIQAAYVDQIGLENYKLISDPIFEESKLNWEWLERRDPELGCMSPLELGRHDPDLLKKHILEFIDQFEHLEKRNELNEFEQVYLKENGALLNKDDLIKHLRENHSVLSGENLWIRDGWLSLANDCLNELRPYRNSFEIFEIKEKSGELRVIPKMIGSKSPERDQVREKIREIVTRYRELSKTVCDICGEAGVLEGGQVRCELHKGYAGG